MRGRGAWARFGIGAALAAVGLRPVSAEHFDLLLRLRSGGPGGGVAEASWDTSPPEGGLNRRPVLVAAPGEELRLEWVIRSAYPHGVMERVQVRLFVVPEAEVGQRKVPPIEGAVVDERFTMTFRPKHAARGRLRFRAPGPGAYLVRLDSTGTLAEHGHEHFAAIDLQVRPAKSAGAEGGGSGTHQGGARAVE